MSVKSSAIKKTLIVVAGPTAVGKTTAAITLALHYKTVVVSADSRQLFREMNIGTAKPNAAELAEVKHYFIDSQSIADNFSVGDFEEQGLNLLAELFETHDKVILAGGSGLYIKAICEGFDDLPTADPTIRGKLNKEFAAKGIEWLQQQLQIADPAYYEQVDINNPQRIIRALEVFEISGKPFSSYRQARVNQRPFNIVKLALNRPREVLYNHINERVDAMIEHGLLAEVESLLPYRHYNALNTVGYSELFQYVDKKINLADAVALIKQNTRRFAKRQLTWFRKDPSFTWLDAGEPELVKKMIGVIQNQITD